MKACGFRPRPNSHAQQWKPRRKFDELVEAGQAHETEALRRRANEALVDRPIERERPSSNNKPSIHTF